MTTNIQLKNLNIIFLFWYIWLKIGPTEVTKEKCTIFSPLEEIIFVLEAISNA